MSDEYDLYLSAKQDDYERRRIVVCDGCGYPAQQCCCEPKTEDDEDGIEPENTRRKEGNESS